MFIVNNIVAYLNICQEAKKVILYFVLVIIIIIIIIVIIIINTRKLVGWWIYLWHRWWLQKCVFSNSSFHTLIICSFCISKREKSQRLFIKIILSLHWTAYATFVKDHFLIYLSVYLWNLYSVLLFFFFFTFKTSTRCL